MVSARTPVGRKTLLVIRATGLTDGLALRANSDEGWYDKYQENPARPGHVIVMGERLEVVRVTGVPFDLVDRDTGEVLAESK